MVVRFWRKCWNRFPAVSEWRQPTARALTALQVDERIQARVEDLAEKCNEGQITEDERAEYEAYVQASTLIGILQAKARQKLAFMQFLAIKNEPNYG